MRFADLLEADHHTAVERWPHHNHQGLGNHLGLDNQGVPDRDNHLAGVPDRDNHLAEVPVRDNHPKE